MTLLVARTARGGADNLDGPRHAVTDPPRRYSRTGGTFVAICNTQVRGPQGETWDGTHPRDCKKCVKAAKELPDG